MYWPISHQQRLGAEILSITSICIVSLLFQFVKAHNPFSQSTAAFLLLAAYYLLLIQQTCVDWVKNSRLLLFFFAFGWAVNLKILREQKQSNG